MALTEDEHLGLIKDAIDAVLRARLEYDNFLESKRTTDPIKFEFIDMTGWGDPVPNNRDRLRSIIKDPVRKSLRKTLKGLGKELFQLLGNTDAMLEVAEEVANREPKKWGHRIDIIDKTWDGIGNDTDVWVT